MVTAKILSGLPPYGPLATTFPSEWGRLAREGIVVEFKAEAGAWAHMAAHLPHIIYAKTQVVMLLSML